MSKEIIPQSRRINWEFREITASGLVTIGDNPAEIRFIYNYQAAAGSPAIINGSFKMDGYNNFTIGGIAQKYPFELILCNDKDEIDTTTYDVRLPQGDTMSVVVKYYKPYQNCNNDKKEE